ncbi:MAG: CarD family transcriptional regulator, partial [Clostridia bacterium]
MYQVDDVVVYGLHGVCRITQIEPKIFAGEEHL